MDGQVHRRARRHESLEEAGAQRPGPLGQVEGADKPVPDAHVAAAHLHLHRRLLVELAGSPAQGCGYEEHPQPVSAERVDGQAAPRQHPPQLVHAGELAHGVEASVEDAVPGLKVGQQPAQGLGGRPRLRGQVVRLGVPQLLPQPAQARRVLPDEQLDGEVAGV